MHHFKFESVNQIFLKPVFETALSSPTNKHLSLCEFVMNSKVILYSNY